MTTAAASTPEPGTPGRPVRSICRADPSRSGLCRPPSPVRVSASFHGPTEWYWPPPVGAFDRYANASNHPVAYAVIETSLVASSLSRPVPETLVSTRTVLGGSGTNRTGATVGGAAPSRHTYRAPLRAA